MDELKKMHWEASILVLHVEVSLVTPASSLFQSWLLWFWDSFLLMRLGRQKIICVGKQVKLFKNAFTNLLTTIFIFWSLGSLSMVNKHGLVDNKRYLLAQRVPARKCRGACVFETHRVQQGNQVLQGFDREKWNPDRYLQPLQVCCFPKAPAYPSKCSWETTQPSDSTIQEESQKKNQILPQGQGAHLKFWSPSPNKAHQMDPTEHGDRKLAAGILRLPVKIINKGTVVSGKLISTVFNALATNRDTPTGIHTHVPKRSMCKRLCTMAL